MEEQTVIELSDGGFPTASSTDTISGFEWCTCDLTVEECCADVSDHLMDKGQKEGEDKFVTIWSRDYIRWTFCPPGYLPDLHIGIWDGSSRKLVAFAPAVLIRVRVMEESSRMARIYFPMVRSNFRDRIPAKIVLNELIRRVRLENIRWVVKRKLTLRPAPMAFPLWRRPLNSRALFEHGYFKNVAMTLPEITEFYQLPLSPDIQGFKIMKGSHVEPLTGLLREYLRKFKVTPEFDEDAVKHWFLPAANLLHSYVYIGPDGNIRGFCSFITVREYQKDVELTLAFLSYNFTIGMPLQQLMKCTIIIAKGIHCDIFIAFEIMGNGSFLTELRFSPTRFHIQDEFDLNGIGDLTKDDIGLVLL